MIGGKRKGKRSVCLNAKIKHVSPKEEQKQKKTIGQFSDIFHKNVTMQINNPKLARKKEGKHGGRFKLFSFLLGYIYFCYFKLILSWYLPLIL